MNIRLIYKTRLVLVKGDITKVKVDAIVNAANSRLIGGGGVDGAIHKEGGDSILAECRKLGGCPTGQAVITTAGRLKAKKIIHTVGPIYRNTHKDSILLASCYINSLKLTIRYALRIIAFPSISTGAYGYPLNEAAPIALKTVITVIKTHVNSFDEIYFVLFKDKAYQIYSQFLNVF